MERQVFGIKLDDLTPLCASAMMKSRNIVLNLPSEIATMLKCEEELFVERLEKVQKTIPKDIVGPKRAEMVLAEMAKI